MKLRGVVRTAELQENPAAGDQIELLLRLQGVGAGQPRVIVIPFGLLLEDEAISVEEVSGRGFEAEVGQDDSGRWVVARIAFASRVLRRDEPGAG